MEFKKGQLISFIDDLGIKRTAIVLPVTEQDIKRGVSAEYPGLYAFRLMSKGQPYKIKTYAKMYEIDPEHYKDTRIIRENLCGLSKYDLRMLLE